MTDNLFQLDAETKADWLSQSEVWLREADPRGLTDVPIYLVDLADVADVVKFGEVRGAMSALMSLKLKPHLEATRRWTGPGFACVIDMDQQPNLMALDCLVLHEFGHFVDVAAGLSCSIVKLLKYCDEEGTPAATADKPLRSGFESLDDSPPWKHHGAQFARAIVHLAYRAGRDSNDVFWGPDYWLSRASDYAAHLGDEPERLADESLVEILCKSAPIRSCNLQVKTSRAQKHVTVFGNHCGPPIRRRTRPTF